MFRTNELPVLNYGRCEKIMKGSKNKKSVKLCNETYLRRYEDYFTVELFGNEILQIEPTCQIATMAGYQTVTTKQRLNQLTNHIWFQKDYDMFISKMPCNCKGFSFEDSVPIEPNKYYRLQYNLPVEELSYAYGRGNIE